MGYIKHHTIVVTSSGEFTNNAHNKAKEIFGHLCSVIIYSKCNFYSSFFIAPDGSKEGWDQSDLYDLKRKEFINWINEQAYEDGSNAISFAELFYGEDNGYSEIVNHN